MKLNKDMYDLLHKIYFQCGIGISSESYNEIKQIVAEYKGERLFDTSWEVIDSLLYKLLYYSIALRPIEYEDIKYPDLPLSTKYDDEESYKIAKSNYNFIMQGIQLDLNNRKIARKEQIEKSNKILDECFKLTKLIKEKLKEGKDENN